MWKYNAYRRHTWIMTIAHIHVHDSSGEMGWILNMNLFTRVNTSILLLNSVKKIEIYGDWLIDWLIDWCLMPTLAVFQLYHHHGVQKIFLEKNKK